MKKTKDQIEIQRAIIQVLKDGKKDTFQEILKQLTAYELSEHYREMPLKRQPLFLEFLSKQNLADLLQHLSQDEQLHVLRTIGPVRSTDILEMMKNNDLASLFSGLPKNQIEKLTVEMRKEVRENIRHIMQYPPKTAGRAMNNRYLWVHQSYSVEQAIKKLKHFTSIATYQNYLYVIDDEKKLCGVVSYKDLLLADPEAQIIDIMTESPITVNVKSKEEEIARLIGRHDFVSIPVVNDDGILVGIIAVDDMLDIVVREANEDIEMLLASGKAIDFRTKPLVAAKRRLPWLILLLFIGLVSGSIISRFEATLEQVVALAFFMPMIAGMTGNTGTQSLAVVVRGLVSEDLTLKKSLKLLLRELIVGIIIGVTCAILIAVIAYVWQGSFVLGLVIGSSLLATLIIGTIAGTIIPLVLHKFNVDPAVASGPLITTINDILSLLIYFGIATMFLSKLM